MKNRPRFTLSLLGVAIAGMLLLSGCITMHSDITIKADGSGTQSIIVAMSKEMTALGDQGNQGQTGTPTAKKDPLADARSGFKTLSDEVPGATFAPYTDDAGQSGFEVVLPFKSLDELVKLQVRDKPSDMDVITFTKSGTVITLKMDVNTSSMAGKVSPDEPAAATKTPQEQAMQAQMMTAMGMDVSYSLALPGKILDWAPKENVTYDPVTNKLLWAADLSKPLNISVKWDNSKKPEKIDVPAAAAATEAATPDTTMTEAATPEATAEATTTDMEAGTPTPASSSAVGSAVTLETLTQYTQAMMAQDQAALKALTTGGKAIGHPLRTKIPDMFKADDLSIVYTATFADAKMGGAQWQAQWTKDGNGQTLAGLDVLTFDGEGKIKSIRSYVDPTGFSALTSTN